MRALETMKNDSSARVVYSHSFPDRSHNSVHVSAAPTLIVGETISSATKLFIAKRRSEIAGLDALLKSLMNPPLKAK